MGRRCSGMIVALALLLGGCAGMQSRAVSSSYAFLYPDTKEKIEEPGIATLNLPVRVGVAFVPDTQMPMRRDFWTGMTDAQLIPEARKREMLEQVAHAFEGRDFIGSIEIIPSAYLRAGGGFDNLDQLSTMYDVDIIALVSYDQIQTTDEGFASLSYWTLVGAYVIEGEKNTTTTLMDTVVYDIASRRMLFRAPGISEVKGSATLVNQSEALREDGLKGLSLATTEMIANLDAELARFREKVKERPADFRVVPSAGYHGGGGALGVSLLSLMLAWAMTRPSR